MNGQAYKLQEAAASPPFYTLLAVAWTRRDGGLLGSEQYGTDPLYRDLDITDDPCHPRSVDGTIIPCYKTRMTTLGHPHRACKWLD